MNTGTEQAWPSTAFLDALDLPNPPRDPAICIKKLPEVIGQIPERSRACRSEWTLSGILELCSSVAQAAYLRVVGESLHQNELIRPLPDQLKAILPEVGATISQLVMREIGDANVRDSRDPPYELSEWTQYLIGQSILLYWPYCHGLLEAIASVVGYSQTPRFCASFSIGWLDQLYPEHFGETVPEESSPSSLRMFVEFQLICECALGDNWTGKRSRQHNLIKTVRRLMKRASLYEQRADSEDLRPLIEQDCFIELLPLLPPDTLRIVWDSMIRQPELIVYDFIPVYVSALCPDIDLQLDRISVERRLHLADYLGYAAESVPRTSVAHSARSLLPSLEYTSFAIRLAESSRGSWSESSQELQAFTDERLVCDLVDSSDLLASLLYLISQDKTTADTVIDVLDKEASALKYGLLQHVSRILSSEKIVFTPEDSLSLVRQAIVTPLYASRVHTLKKLTLKAKRRSLTSFFYNFAKETADEYSRQMRSSCISLESLSEPCSRAAVFGPGYDTREASDYYMARLSEQDREIIRMRVFEDLPNAEVARRLGVSPAKASKRYHRVLKRLRIDAREICP